MPVQDSESSLDKAVRLFSFLFSVPPHIRPENFVPARRLVKLERERGAASLTLIPLHAQPPTVSLLCPFKFKPSFRSISSFISTSH